MFRKLGFSGAHREKGAARENHCPFCKILLKQISSNCFSTFVCHFCYAKPIHRVKTMNISDFCAKSAFLGQPLMFLSPLRLSGIDINENSSPLRNKELIGVFVSLIFFYAMFFS